jgi:hypothetical protein
MSTGPDHRYLKEYKAENLGDGSRYFIDAAHKFKEKLEAHRDELVRRHSLTPWKIPEVHIVHIGGAVMLRSLFKWRMTMWNSYQDQKDTRAREAAAEEARLSIDIPPRPLHVHNQTGWEASEWEAVTDSDEEYEYLASIECSRLNYPAEYEDVHRSSWILSEYIAPPETWHQA